MSIKELDRLGILSEIEKGLINQQEAAKTLGLTDRQVAYPKTCTYATIRSMNLSNDLNRRERLSLSSTLNNRIPGNVKSGLHPRPEGPGFTPSGIKTSCLANDALLRIVIF